MTWEAIVYGLLAVTLVGGLVWYERSRPPARMVALVAALAALAVAGRLAFAPIPNVVATTDIVLITGYAVGAAPGFAVGALAAAVSNLWLGQGPWTPWQMVGWGLVGLGGAALAVATRRRLGRGGLAVACGLAGLAYGALLDLSVMVTYGGEQSFDRYLAISSRGVPFNVAHAVGNVVLALAAGPALVRMISRYRSRFEFTWRRASAASLTMLLALALLLPATSALAGASASASGWLQGAEGSDGGFGPGPGDPSSPAMTGWAALGVEAAGHNPLDLGAGGPSPIAYLRAHAAELRSTGDLERTLLALEGAGVSARRFGGRDLAAELRARRSPGGSFEGEVNLTAFGILALRAAGTPASALSGSAAWLRKAENGDGGWGFQPNASSDPDSTGAALQGLVAARGKGRAATRGAAFLRRVQQHDGGYALIAGAGSNTQSTAWAVQGLIAAGANPAAVRNGGRSPFDYLAARQASDGHYRYSSSSDQTPIWVTGQALLAVNHKAFPLAAVPRSPTGGGSPAAPAPTSSGTAASSGSGGGAPATTAGGGGPPSSLGGDEGSAPGGPGAAQGAGNRAGRPLATVDPVSAPVEPAAAPSDGGGGLSTAAYVAGGFGVLIAALTGGFLVYRRRLP